MVAVRSSGIDDVVKQGVNGFKTPERVDQWCEKVRQLLEDEGQREALSASALQFSREYSTEQFARNVHEIYAMILAQRADSDVSSGQS